MNQLAFFDTNVLVYADDSAALRKQQKAIDLIANHIEQQTAVISTQVLQEYFVTITRKLGVEAKMAQDKVETLISGCKVVRPAVSDIVSAIELNRLESISFWDALIVHCARSVQASILFTEDLQAGRRYGQTQIQNPFSEKPRR